MGKRLYTVEELAVLLGCSVHSIDNWYLWKRKHPEHELAKLLPDYKQLKSRQTRYWEESDVWKINEFRTKLPRGKNGILGDVTQTSYRRKRGKLNAEKVSGNDE